MATFPIMAGIERARTLPDGIGVRADALPGFVIKLISNHDDADTFKLGVLPTFAPPEVENPGLLWDPINQVDVILILSAVIQFSERHFGRPDDMDPEVIADIEQFLRDQA